MGFQFTVVEKSFESGVKVEMRAFVAWYKEQKVMCKEASVPGKQTLPPSCSHFTLMSKQNARVRASRFCRHRIKPISSPLSLYPRSRLRHETLLNPQGNLR